MNKKQILELIEQKCCCGGSQDVPTPETGCCYEAITLEQAQLLATNSSIIPNKMYKITGVHKNKQDLIVNTLFDDGTNSGTTIYLTGLTPTEFSTEGWGEFYNPKYDHNNYGETEALGASAILDTQGTLYTDQTGVQTVGGSGTGMFVDITTDAGAVITVTISNPGTGYVPGDYITIDSGDETAKFYYVNGYYLYNVFSPGVDSFDIPGYQLGRKIIWGGYVWENISGTNGFAVDQFNLDGVSWSKVAYNETDYSKVVDYIEYDFANDWICRRRQAEPVIDVIYPFQFWNDATQAPADVVFHAIPAMQWGNKYNKNTHLGVGLMNIIDSYFEIVNFTGRYALGGYMNNYSWAVGLSCSINTYLKGIVFDNYSYIKNLYLQSGSYIGRLTLNNASYLLDWKMKESSALTDISLENNSYLHAAEGSYLQASIMSNLRFDNLCYISGQTLINSTINGFTLKNQAYIGPGTMTDSMAEFCVLESAVIGLNLTSQNLYNSSFKNNSYFGSTSYTNASPGVTYNLKNDGLHGTVELYIQFTGAAGRGAVGALTLPGIGITPGWYIEKVIARTNTLTAGAGSYLNLGIETDNTTSGLDNVDGLVTALNASPAVVYTNLGFEYATDNRLIVMSVGANAITAGELYLTIELRKSLRT